MNRTAPVLRRQLKNRSYPIVKPAFATSFAQKAEQRKKYIAKSEHIRKETRQKKITLFRKYREGELPDIEIKYKEILDPLQSLARRDIDIARQLLTLIFASLYSKMKEGVCVL